MLKTLLAPALAAGCVFLLAASAANAAPADFYLGSTGFDTDDSFQYSSSGIDLTATALALDGDDVQSALLNRSVFGLGIYSSRRDDNAIDGHGKTEILRLSFSQPVQLWGASFVDGFDCCDDFDLDVDGSPGLDDESTSLLWIAKDLQLGTQFDFIADHKSDSFKLKWVRVKPQDPSIPEPSAALVFGAGLLILRGAARRRRR